MDTKDKIILNLDGKNREIVLDKLSEELSINALYSGSISLGDENEKSSYYFSLVNSEELCYVLNKAKQNANEVQIEVRSHAKDTEGIQPESFEKPNL